jgi:hypothetical protein
MLVSCDARKRDDANDWGRLVKVWVCAHGGVARLTEREIGRCDGDR